VLALRVKEYTPQWLDRLCFTGRVGWGRLSPPQTRNGRAFTPLRSSPIALFSREHLPQWLELSGRSVAEFSADTALVLHTLADAGALFFAEIVRRTGLLSTRVEQSLGELAAHGWVTADSFEGLRALLIAPEKRAPFADTGRSRRHKTVTSVEFAGRWTLLRNAANEPATKDARVRDEAIETFARTLLRRYGVMFRRLLERESLSVSWFELSRFYRRLEARGEIRGGYFVGGVSGEQFALPGAIGMLRSIRNAKPTEKPIVLSAADPLNLVGILPPGPRIAAIASNRILLQDGIPVAGLEAGKIVSFNGASDVGAHTVERALTVGQMPIALRPYYA